MENEYKNGNKKIPVYIWYEDIDQKEVDLLTKEETGLTPADCEVIEEFPLPELFEDSDKNSKKIEKEIEKYLEKTNQVREKERKLTDKYTSVHRKLANSKYREKSTKIISELSINSNSVTFNSEFAPVFTAELNNNEIKKICKSNDIIEIGYYPEFKCVSPSVSEDEGVEAKESMRVTELLNKVGLSGQDVNVGLIEINIPGIVIDENNVVEELEISLEDVTIVEEQGYEITPSKYTPSIDHGHAYNTFRVMAGSQTGFAKNINMYATNLEIANIEKLLKATNDDSIDILLINVCWLIYDRIYTDYLDSDSYSILNTSYAYTMIDRYFDHIVSQHNITTVVAGGNWGTHENDWFDNSYNEDTGHINGWQIGARVCSPGMSHNVITVGGYSNNNSGEKESDDFLVNYSWKNSHENMYGCEKPDVLMPMNFPGGGTSVSSPALTATLALMFELKPSLAFIPQAVKAIVLASCHRKAIQTDAQGGQETMEQGITERQGAGIPDAMTMASIISQGTYGIGVLNDVEDEINIQQPLYGATNMNVSLSWIKENLGYNDHVTPNYNNVEVTEGENHNLNLSVFHTNAEIASSNLLYSSTEMCYFKMPTNNNKYRFKITQPTEETTVRYGYAWSTDNFKTAYIPADVSEEGIYYLKNAENNTYIYNDYYYGNLQPQALLDTVEKQTYYGLRHYWILRSDGILRSDDNKTYYQYYLYSGLGTEDYYLSQGTTSIDSSITTLLSSTGASYYIKDNDGGTRSIIDEVNNKILSYNGSNTVWDVYDSNNIQNKQKWYFEKVGFLRGDVNMDGAIDDNDEELLSQYLLGVATLTPIRKFTADIDRNGNLNVNDLTMLQKILTGTLNY